jgi:hypothetical protein
MAFGDLLQFPPPGSPPAKANITERSRRHMSEECNTLIRNQTDHNPGKLYFVIAHAGPSCTTYEQVWISIFRK